MYIKRPRCRRGPHDGITHARARAHARTHAHIHTQRPHCHRDGPCAQAGWAPGPTQAYRHGPRPSPGPAGTRLGLGLGYHAQPGRTQSSEFKLNRPASGEGLSPSSGIQDGRSDSDRLACRATHLSLCRRGFGFVSRGRVSPGMHSSKYPSPRAPE